MSRAKFTIILPVYNGGAYLKQCVGSLLAQTVPEFEILALDDASSDGSREWLENVDDARLKVYPAPQNLGIVANWARALEMPKAEFMTIIGQDDVLDANFLEVVQELIAREPDARLFQTQFRLMDENGVTLRAATPQPPRETAAEFLRARFRQERESFAPGYVMRSADYENVGGIPHFEKLMYADDALWLLLLQGSYKVAATPECWAYRTHTSSVSAAAHWRTHLAAMQQYIEFLQTLAQRDATLLKVLSDDGPAYFLSLCRQMYLLALVEATKKQQPLAPDAPKVLAETLAKIAPHLVSQIFSPRALRLRRFINQNRAARSVYRSYIRARYGSDELP